MALVLWTLCRYASIYAWLETLLRIVKKMKYQKLMRCNKDLYSEEGTHDFVKGTLYPITNFTDEGVGVELKESTETIDHQDEPHQLGIWRKHFSLIPGMSWA